MTRLMQQAVTKPWDASCRQRLAELCRILNKPGEAEMWHNAAAACPPVPTGTRK
jgi:hypothetical protein